LRYFRDSCLCFIIAAPFSEFGSQRFLLPVFVGITALAQTATP
jgi:hypothetical protein